MRVLIASLAIALAVGVGPISAQEKKSEQPAETKETEEAPSPKTEEAQPKIEVTPAALDFGEIWIGTPAKQVFTIRNTGKAPLTIKAKSSCGCTVATKPKSPLKPGESTEFSVSYNTKRAGRANKKVTLTTNDPDNKKIVIPVTGKVKALFDTAPSSVISFRNLSTDSRESQTIHLKNQHSELHTLKLKEGQKFNGFEVSLKEITAGKEYALTVSTVPPLKTSNNRTNIIIETGSDISPTIKIPVRANIQAKVYMVPSTVFVVDDSSAPKTQTLRLHHRTDVPMKVVDVKFGDKSLAFEMKSNKQREGRAYAQQYISVTLPNMEEIGSKNDKLVVVTDNKDYAEIEVPIRKRPKPALRNAPHKGKHEAKRKVINKRAPAKERKAKSPE